MGRSTARRLLTAPRLPDPAEQVDGRTLRPRAYSDDAGALLEHVWALMGMPCGKYLVVMLELWLPRWPPRVTWTGRSPPTRRSSSCRR